MEHLERDHGQERGADCDAASWVRLSATTAAANTNANATQSHADDAGIQRTRPRTAIGVPPCSRLDAEALHDVLAVGASQAGAPEQNAP